jgi:hypothetical protein
MAAMSDYLEQLVINHILRTNTFAKPTSLAIALLTTAAVDSDTGKFTAGTGIEVANTFEYARQSITLSDAAWKDPSTATQGLTQNLVDITWPVALGGTWGTVVAVAIVDSDIYDAGNMLLHGLLNDPVTINNGDTFKISLNDLNITFD